MVSSDIKNRRLLRNCRNCKQKGKERKGKERKGKERKGKERKKVRSFQTSRKEIYKEIVSEGTKKISIEETKQIAHRKKAIS